MSDLRSAKRSACDRCRTQKLRCLRLQCHPTDSCLRCVRAHTECVTTSTKRPGRPPRNPPRIRPPDLAPSSPTRRSSATGNTGNVQFDSVNDWFNPDSLNTPYDISSACWALSDLPVDSKFPPLSTTRTDEGTSFTMSSPPAPTIIPSLHSSSELGFCYPSPPHGPIPDCDHSHGGHGRTGLGAVPLGKTSSTSDRIEGMMPLFGHLPPTPPSAQDCDHRLQLSALYRNLSQQLFTLRSTAWDMAGALQLTCAHDANNTTTNPLAHITKSSDEFAHLLRSLQLPITNDTGGNTPNPVITNNTRLSIADLLTAISCHMLLIFVYDTILCNVLNHPAALQFNTNLFFGGIPVPLWPGLLPQVLVCLVEIRLREVEGLLGLPGEFCVSGRSNRDDDGCGYTGLFGGESGRSLITALMQVETERSFGCGERGGLGVIEALRERMGRVRELKLGR